MSSIVENNVSGGVDLNSLTSGERWLIGMLGTHLTANPKCNLGTDFNTKGDLDFSKVNTIEVQADSRNTNHVTIHLYTFTPSIQEVDSTGSLVAGASATLTAGGRPDCLFYVQNNTSIAYFSFTSFTTTDGKVHTASNLNY